MVPCRAFLLLIGLPLMAGAQDLPWRSARVLPPEPATHNFFGFDIALSGDTLAAGAVEKTFQGFAVYLSVRHAGEWVPQATVRLPDPGTDHMLPSIALSGDTLAVGMPGENAPGVDSGAAYVFVRRNGLWSLQARLTASDARASNLFGSSVAVSADRLAVGAIRGGGPSGLPGAAYVFRRSGETWQEEARLSPGDVTQGFGIALDFDPSGDLLAVGAPWDQTGSLTPGLTGSVHLYRRHGTAWIREALFRGPQNAQLGETVSLSDRSLVVGSVVQRAFVYSRQGGAWHREAVLTRGDDPEATGYFGWFVATSGPWTVAFGGRNPDAPLSDFGAYLFERREDGTWIRQGLLDGALAFGASVDLDGDTIAFGAGNADPAGGALVYTPLASDVDLAVRLLAPAGPIQTGELFAYRARVFNRGTSPADKVALRLRLPEGVELISVQSETGVCRGTEPVICRLGSLPPGSSALVAVQALASEAGANTAAAAVSASRFDSNPADNSAAVTTQIER